MKDKDIVRWKGGKFGAVYEGGVADIPAKVNRGLAVHKTIDHYGGEMEGQYGISHIASGYSLSGKHIYESQRDAIVVADIMLERLKDVDWTLDQQALIAKYHDLGNRVSEILNAELF